MVGEFAASIREGRAARTDGHAGLRVLGVLEAASRSLADGGRLTGVDDPVRAAQLEVVACNALRGASTLVTGGAGTIGSTIVDQLFDEGVAHVDVLDNLVGAAVRTWRTPSTTAESHSWRVICATSTSSAI